MTLALTLLFPVVAHAAKARPLRTGQSTCWNSIGGVISCSGTRQDGALKKGVARGYADNGDGTITDLKTRLTWEKLDRSGGIHDKGASYDWAGAFTKIAMLDTPPCFAGHCDWRLPNAFELFTLVNLENASPAVSPDFNSGCSAGCTATTCSCTASAGYWSSSTYAPNPETAWLVFFDTGVVIPPANKGKGGFVRRRALRARR